MMTVGMAVARTVIVGCTAEKSFHIRNYSGPEVEVEDDYSLVAGQPLLVAHTQIAGHTPTADVVHSSIAGHRDLDIVIGDTPRTVENTGTQGSRLAGRLTRGMEDLGGPDTLGGAGDRP
jgi:hypothetical protein